MIIRVVYTLHTNSFFFLSLLIMSLRQTTFLRTVEGRDCQFRHLDLYFNFQSLFLMIVRMADTVDVGILHMKIAAERQQGTDYSAERQPDSHWSK